MIHDLRSYLEVLKQNNELLTVSREVDPVGEIGAVMATLETTGGEAAFFKNVKGFDIPVAGGMLSDHRKIALALGCRPDEISRRIETALENPVKPETVESAVFKENVLKGNEIDLTKLPIPVHAPEDGGPFITGGVTFSKSLRGGRQNLSFHRMLIKGPVKTGVMINEWRHLRHFLNEAEESGTSLPIAVAVGLDPVILIAAGFRSDLDEIELAGALRGRPVRMARCETCDIMVPAESEFVIEGEIRPGEREDEGPLAEFTGHYGALWPSPVFHVTAVCHRNKPIWQTINGASFEHINLGNVLSREPMLMKYAKYVSKNVRAVHLPPYGSGFLALVSVDKQNEGEPKNIAMAAMTSHVNIKNVIVVDSDVDIYNPADVMWALSNRVDPREDIFIIPNAQGHELDPGSDETGVQNKMGIDATLSKKKSHLKKVVYPTVDLSKYRSRDSGR